jgi:hypothetical protein
VALSQGERGWSVKMRRENENIIDNHPLLLPLVPSELVPSSIEGVEGLGEGCKRRIIG